MSHCDAAADSEMEGCLELVQGSEAASSPPQRLEPRSFRGPTKCASAALLGVALLGVSLALQRTKASPAGLATGETVSLLGLPAPLQNLLSNLHLPFGPAPAPAYYPGMYHHMQPGMQPGVHPPGMPPQAPGAPAMPPGAPPAATGVSGGMAQTAPSAFYDCNTGYHKSGWATGWSQAQMDWCCQTYQKGCRKPRRMNFYMYRAQSDDNYPMNNVNLGDLPGVMWYLHNEVLVSTPRKFNVTRLMRFRVTMMTTPQSYAVTHGQFGQFTAFDTGRCTVPGCDQIFQRDGYVVGCQNTNSAQGLGNYVSLSTYPCTPPNCKEGTWYSLPGPCPAYYYSQRPYMCNVTAPGGQCQFIYGEGGGVTGFEEAPVTGNKDCTYYAKWAGQVYLNELMGLQVVEGPQNIAYEAYTSWWQQGNAEYNVQNDNGVCAEGYDCSFWKGRNNQTACAERMRKIQYIFDTKFPFYPKTADLGEAPPCDAV